MRRKLTAILLAGLLLALTGCRLARPEAESASEDRFTGVYVVYTQGYDNGFYENPNLTEYGSETLDIGEYGNVSVPRQVLLAERDEAAGRYIFPGLEGGYSLFALDVVQEDGSICHTMASNMAADGAFELRQTDEGDYTAMSGVIYFGPPAGAGADWDDYEAGGVWHAYRVYQTPDGVPYLDGGGNTYGGGGNMEFTLEETYTTAVDGEETTESISAKVSIEAVPRLEKLVVSQFDESNALLRSDDLALGEDLPPAQCLPEAAWVLVEEHFTDGTAERTAYNVPGPGGEPISHQVILLDGDGLGAAAYLTIQ